MTWNLSLLRRFFLAFEAFSLMLSGAASTTPTDEKGVMPLG